MKRVLRYLRAAGPSRTEIGFAVCMGLGAGLGAILTAPAAGCW